MLSRFLHHQHIRQQSNISGVWTIYIIVVIHSWLSFQQAQNIFQIKIVNLNYKFNSKTAGVEGTGFVPQQLPSKECQNLLCHVENQRICLPIGFLHTLNDDLNWIQQLSLHSTWQEGPMFSMLHNLKNHIG